jgi:hypothetical protein
MPSTAHSLGGIAAVYTAAVQHGEPTLAFEVAQGRGRFVFLMFFSEEDEDSRDRLFLFLRNTNYMLELKLYGNHFTGGTKVYLTPEKERCIRDELRLGPGGDGFEWQHFFAQLNEAIPQKLSLQATLDELREVWPDVRERLPSVLDEAEKTVLVGIRRLPPSQHPRDRTLRKLYTYTRGGAADIQRLIQALMSANITLVWTNEDGAEGRSFAAIFADVARAGASS